MKKCTKCKKEQLEDNFNKDKAKKDGLCPICRTCRGIKHKAEKHINLGKIDNRYYRFGSYYLHRYIMEQYLGRKLVKGEVVHHINGDKHDNRIENLELIDDKLHRSQHSTGKKYPTRYINCVCVICGNKFISKNKPGKYCSGSCIYQANKEYVKQWVKKRKERQNNNLVYETVSKTGISVSST